MNEHIETAIYVIMILMVVIAMGMFVIGAINAAGRADDLNEETWKRHNDKLKNWHKQLRGKQHD